MNTIHFGDAASVVAASKCWLHRNSPMRLTERGAQPGPGERPRTRRMTHPDECGWCVYPGDVLVNAISEFLESMPSAVASFEQLPWSTQQRMVLKAQGFEEPEPERRRTSRVA